MLSHAHLVVSRKLIRVVAVNCGVDSVMSLKHKRVSPTFILVSCENCAGTIKNSLFLNIVFIESETLWSLIKWHVKCTSSKVSVTIPSACQFGPNRRRTERVSTINFTRTIISSNVLR